MVELDRILFSFFFFFLSTDRVKTQLMELLEAPMVIEGKEVKAVQELPWYPGGLAYRLGCDRRFIRKQPHLVSGVPPFHEGVPLFHATAVSVMCRDVRL